MRRPEKTGRRGDPENRPNLLFAATSVARNGYSTGMPEHGQAGPPSGPGGHPFPLNLGRTGQNRERKPWPPLPERLERLGRRRVLAAGALILFLLVSGISLMIFAAKVRALRERHATGPSWAFPSLVYSDGLPLVPGRSLPRGYMRKHLDAREYQ
jgi:hypothetical protein